MTITEAAEVLGLAPSTLRLQVKLGKLKAHRMGGRLYVTSSEVGRYAAEHLRTRPENHTEPTLSEVETQE